MELLTRIWQGELGLGKTFWLIAIPAYFVVSTLLSQFGLLLIGGRQFGSLVVYGALIAASVFVLLSFIPAWKSASKHPGKKAYAYLAKFWLLLQGFGLLMHYYVFHLIHQNPQYFNH